MDGAYARRLLGEDMFGAPVLCSRERPFGIHADLSGHHCPRCGWAPARRRAAAARGRPLTLC
ncbi:MAG TPA: hypothetical protein VF552_12295 [Allosphingosinicella sp.]